nr:MAG TPA: tail protein [Caudoviricetes sp.]
MAYKKLQLRRGAKTNLPTLAAGEMGFCTDTKQLYIGTGSENVPVNFNSLLIGALTVAGWTAETGGFKQTLTISGLATSGYTYTVYPNSLQYKVWTEAGIYADDVSTANQITFHCTTKPTVAVTVNIKKEQVG